MSASKRPSLLFLKSGDVVDEARAGGSDVVFDGIVSYLDEIRALSSNRDCTVVSMGTRDAETVSEGLRLITIDASKRAGRSSSLFRAWHRLARIVRESRPDAIIAIDSGYYTLPLWWSSRPCRSSLVLAVPGQIGGARLFDRVRRRIFAATAASDRTIRVLSRGSMLARDVRAAGVDDGKVASYFPQYSTEMLAIAQAPRSSSTGSPEVAFLGRLAPVKGVDVLPAIARLVTELGGVLRVIGDGPSSNEVRRGLEPWIAGGSVVMEGALPTMQALQIVSGADVSVVPSRMEGIAKSVMESIIVGVPVVAYSVGGIPEWVTEGSTGVLVPVGDVDALCSAVRNLLTDPDGMTALRRSTREAGSRLLSTGDTFTVAVSRVLDDIERDDAAGES